MNQELWKEVAFQSKGNCKVVQHSINKKIGKAKHANK